MVVIPITLSLAAWCVVGGFVLLYSVYYTCSFREIAKKSVNITTFYIVHTRGWSVNVYKCVQYIQFIYIIHVWSVFRPKCTRWFQIEFSIVGIAWGISKYNFVVKLKICYSFIRDTFVISISIFISTYSSILLCMT